MPARQKLTLFLIAFLAIFLFFSGKIFAAMSLTFSDAPASVFEGEAFEINVSLVSAPANRTYYFRAAFYEEGKTQYFGYTYNHEGDWHNSPSEHKKFLQITTSEEGSWSGKLKAKADLGASAFKGARSYGFKIGRYTEGGSGPSWSNTTTTIIINISPSPSPSPSLESSPSPAPTPSVQPEESFSPDETPSPKPVKITGATLLGKILGEEETSPAGFFPWEATEEAKSQEATRTSRVKFISKLFLGLGLVFLFVSGVYLWYNQRRQLK